MLGWIRHLQAWPTSTNMTLQKEKGITTGYACFQFRRKEIRAQNSCQCEHGTHRRSLAFKLMLSVSFQRDSSTKQCEHGTHRRSLAFKLMLSVSPQKDSSTKQCEHGTPVAALRFSSRLQFYRKEIRVQNGSVSQAGMQPCRTHAFSFAAKRLISQCEHGTHRRSLAFKLNFQFRRKEIRFEHRTVLWARHARSLALILNSRFQFRRKEIRSQNGSVSTACTQPCI